MFGYPFDDSDTVLRFVHDHGLDDRVGFRVHSWMSGLAELLDSLPAKILWSRGAGRDSASYGIGDDKSVRGEIFWRDVRDGLLISACTSLWKIGHLSSSFAYSWNGPNRNPLNGAVAARAMLEESARFVFIVDRAEGALAPVLKSGRFDSGIAGTLRSIATGSKTGLKDGQGNAVGTKESIAAAVTFLTVRHESEAASVLPTTDAATAIDSRLSAIAHAEGAGRRVFRSGPLLGSLSDEIGEVLSRMPPSTGTSSEIFADCLDGLAAAAMFSVLIWPHFEELVRRVDEWVPASVMPSVFIPVSNDNRLPDSSVQVVRSGIWHYAIVAQQ